MQAKINGDIPTDLHTAAAVKRPSVGFAMVANSKHEPTTRTKESTTRKNHPADFAKPCRSAT